MINFVDPEAHIFPSRPIQPPTLKQSAVAALWRVIEGDNDARQQHKDISTLLSALELLPENP